MRPQLVMLGSLLLGVPAAGQGVIPAIGDPALPRLPTLVQPNGSALVVTMPGEPPTVVRRTDGGSQVIVITRPGQPPAVCLPQAAGTLCN